MNDKTRNKDSNIPIIKPAQDEVTSYRRSQERGVRAEAPQQSSFNGTLVFVIIILAFVMGIGGFTLYEVQQKLNQTTILLTKSKDQISELERRLSSTDQDFAKSGNLVERRLESNELEIRKLWDVSNKRNRSWIKNNEAALADARKEIDKLGGTIGGINSSVEEVTGGFEQLDEKMNQLLTSMMDENEELNTQVSMVRGQIQDQSVELSGASRTLSLLTNRVKTTEEAIDAIDQHRKQLNSTITELRAGISQLQSGEAANGGRATDS
jgi:chromosome segregation ATPase|tara:strand:- start:3949 stop:4749 length:801 start_codon:yes stop_codon:yes gene_type:complete